MKPAKAKQKLEPTKPEFLISFHHYMGPGMYPITIYMHRLLVSALWPDA
jgi:hypothetical protein